MAGCGGGSLSLAEYSEQFQALAADLSADLDALDAQMSADPTLADAREVLEEAVLFRSAFQEDLTDLQPPQAVEDIHNDFIDVHARMIDAQRDWADAAEAAASIEELQDSEAAQAFRALNTEVLGICEEFQQRIDATAGREEFGDTPWVPAEMKEVVRVVLGC